MKTGTSSICIDHRMTHADTVGCVAARDHQRVERLDRRGSSGQVESILDQQRDARAIDPSADLHRRHEFYSSRVRALAAVAYEPLAWSREM